MFILFIYLNFVFLFTLQNYIEGIFISNNSELNLNRIQKGYTKTSLLYYT